MAEMELVEVSPAGEMKLATAGVYSVPSGKTLKIETSPRGENILSAQVPQGETWHVNISVTVTVTPD
jgi:hypothetical protein